MLSLSTRFLYQSILYQFLEIAPDLIFEFKTDGRDTLEWHNDQ